MNLYQIKVILQFIEPPVWRTIQIREDTSLDELHEILQIVMGWEDCHLHQFIVDGDCYGIPDPDFPGDLKDEQDVPLNRIVSKGDALIYEYDFGDGWRHELKIEKTLKAEKDTRHPLCLAGERACPPEDCGGFPGYTRMLEILKDPSDEEHEDIKEWIGEDFDPETFDLEKINQVFETD